MQLPFQQSVTVCGVQVENAWLVSVAAGGRRGRSVRESSVWSSTTRTRSDLNPSATKSGPSTRNLTLPTTRKTFGLELSRTSETSDTVEAASTPPATRASQNHAQAHVLSFMRTSFRP